MAYHAAAEGWPLFIPCKIRNSQHMLVEHVVTSATLVVTGALLVVTRLLGTSASLLVTSALLVVTRRFKNALAQLSHESAERTT